MSARPVTPEPENVTAARAALAAAEQALRGSISGLLAARHVVDDADGDVTIAEAKFDDYSTDEARPEWQRVSAHVELRKAQRRLERAQAASHAAETDNDACEQALAATEDALAHAVAHPGSTAETSGPYFASVDEWVREWLVPTWERSVEGYRANGETSFRWSSDWWNHPEAVLRLDALWRAWEWLRQDPNTGMSVWLRDHADHHLPILFSKFGPFRRSEESVPDGDPLPYAPPPQGTYAAPIGDEPPAHVDGT